MLTKEDMNCRLCKGNQNQNKPKQKGTVEENLKITIFIPTCLNTQTHTVTLCIHRDTLKYMELLQYVA